MDDFLDRSESPLVSYTYSNGSLWPSLCKNVFERDRFSKSDWKSLFYAKSTFPDVAINFRCNVDANTSFLAKRFYTLWAVHCRSSLPRVLVKSNANGWSARMQLTVQ